MSDSQEWFKLKALRAFERVAQRPVSKTWTQKRRAQRLMSSARDAGIIICPDACEDCGQPETLERRFDGHHHNGYDDAHALDVKWLCRACHGARHRRDHPEAFAATCDAGRKNGTKGGKAWWASLSEEQRRATIARLTAANRSKLTHEQRVANGRLGGLTAGNGRRKA